MISNKITKKPTDGCSNVAKEKRTIENIFTRLEPNSFSKIPTKPKKRLNVADVAFIKIGGQNIIAKKVEKKDEKDTKVNIKDRS